MTFSIYLYESKRGDKPVKIFIKSLNPKTSAKIAHLIDLLSEKGPLVGMPYVKKMQSNLYELRIRGKTEIRIFFTRINKNIILLHAFKKKSQKTPRKELNIALSRSKLAQSMRFD